MGKKLLLTWLGEVGYSQTLVYRFKNVTTIYSIFCVTGAKVILACRDMDRANKAAEDVRKRSGNDNVTVKKLDLASLQSVRQLAKDVLENEERLDVLINNAGGCIHMV